MSISGNRAWRWIGLVVLAALLLAAPSDGALDLAKALALGVYFLAFVARSPCRSGAAYPFTHGFRSNACSVAQPEAGTASAAGAPETAPSTRLPSTLSAPAATSRSARG